jgi:hypothetical protein
MVITMTTQNLVGIEDNGHVELDSAPLLSFQYQALELDKQVFRLIQVRPQKPDSPIEIDLWHSNISTKYRCLSYMWGDQTEKYDILLNGRAFRVTKNLYEFLDFATQEYIGEPLWIDAICIDQDNIPERGHQVQRMGSVYSGAQEVLVWLGRDFHADLISNWLKTVPFGEYCSVDVEEQLYTLCFHSYWSRAWIAQEILLQANVVFINRKTPIRWGELSLKVLPMRKRSSVRSALSLPLMEMWLERYTQTWVETGTKLSSVWRPQSENETTYPFWELLKSRSEALCMDSRDRIYSILGMSGAYIQEDEFTVDYKEDVLDLFARAGAALGAWCDSSRVTLLMRALEISPKNLYQSLERYRDIWIKFHVSHPWHHARDRPATGSPNKWSSVLFCTCRMMNDSVHRLCARKSNPVAVIIIARPCVGLSKDMVALHLSMPDYDGPGFSLDTFSIQINGRRLLREDACYWSYIEAWIEENRELAGGEEGEMLQIQVPMTRMMAVLDKDMGFGFQTLSKHGRI